MLYTIFTPNRALLEMRARNQAQLIKSLVTIVIHETDQAQRKGRVRSVRLSNTDAAEPDNFKRTYLRALLLAALQKEESRATRKRFRRSLTMITATRA